MSKEILFCKNCDYESDVNTGQKNTCPDCNEYLWFKGVEDISKYKQSGFDALQFFEDLGECHE